MRRFPIPHHRAGRVATTVASAAILLGATFVPSVRASISQHRALAAPVHGGSYSYRTADSADCLDPQKTASGTANVIDSYVFDTLLSIDPKGHYVGNLATKYVVSNGGKRLRFTLRKHVVFSNGDPLTAQDVKFSFDRGLDPATKSPATAPQLKGITSTKVINASTVEIDLALPSRPLLTNLAGAYTAILDKKWFLAHAGATCTRPIGSGPYRVQNTSGDFSTVVLVANTRHNFGPAWVKNKSVPYISTVNFKTIASDATAVSELLSSGVDISAVPGTQLTRVNGHSSVVLHKLKSQSVTFLEFNTARPPFNDIAVRRAFVQLIDRSSMVKAALGGLGQVIYGPLAPGIPYYSKAAGKYMPKYNPSAAAKVIAAKHANGPYNYLTVALPSFTTEAEIIQRSASQAGMQINIVNKSGVGDFVSDAAKGNFDMLELQVTYPDPDVLYLVLHSSQGGGKGLNWTGLTSNPKLDSLLQKGRTTLARKKIGPIYTQAQVLINKQLAYIGLVAPTAILAQRSSIKGYHVDATGAFAIQDVYVKSK
ncbi:MAG: ABC transporter substrate-binding protein [Chloroflexota bacterium]